MPTQRAIFCWPRIVLSVLVIASFAEPATAMEHNCRSNRLAGRSFHKAVQDIAKLGSSFDKPLTEIWGHERDSRSSVRVTQLVDESVPFAIEVVAMHLAHP